MESSLVSAFNSFYFTSKIKAFAFRLDQGLYYGVQLSDFLSDSLDRDYYFAVEAKSINSFKYKTFNFKSRFSEGQLEREKKYCDLVGRQHFTAIEMREGRGKQRSCHFIKSEELLTKINNGIKSIKTEDIKNYPELPREKGKYVINKKVWAKIVA
jgi:hypothetical protein